MTSGTTWSCDNCKWSLHYDSKLYEAVGDVIRAVMTQCGQYPDDDEVLAREIEDHAHGVWCKSAGCNKIKREC